VRITEVSKNTGASADEIRYFESKGYIKSNRIRLKSRQVRDYSSDEVRMIGVLIKYRRQGFEIGSAY